MVYLQLSTKQFCVVPTMLGDEIPPAQSRASLVLFTRAVQSWLSSYAQPYW